MDVAADGQRRLKLKQGGLSPKQPPAIVQNAQRRRLVNDAWGVVGVGWG
jgi:hypothetical protein